jgi:hypothetical protein
MTLSQGHHWKYMTEPKLGWTYGQFLPDVGKPLLDKMRRVQRLEATVTALRREIIAEIRQRWTAADIRAAKIRLARAHLAEVGRKKPMPFRPC